jgi:hypothetical protein
MPVLCENHGEDPNMDDEQMLEFMLEKQRLVSYFMEDVWKPCRYHHQTRQFTGVDIDIRHMQKSDSSHCR